MAVTWRNNGEKTEEGDYIVDVDPENGTPVQTFRAKTRKEMADALGAAQFSATRTIDALKKERTPDPAHVTARIEPKPLSADERMQLSRDLIDPAKADSVVKRIAESVYGDLTIVAQRENARAEEEERQRAIDETNQFVAATPDWHPTSKNKTEVFNYIEGNQLAITAKNMGIAWDLLKSTGNADLKPVTPEGEVTPVPLPPPNGTRPRLAGFSTGIREGDINGTPPTPGTKKKYTWADVDKMGDREYQRRLKEEPGFFQAMNELGPRK
jgi:hypothetical protein